MKSPTIRRALIAVAAFAGLAANAGAGEIKSSPTAVIELFTSQGCSSCPPADALLTELGARDDIVALAYHVDYWDYIGWADTFGSGRFSDLQRDYAMSFGERRVYTPQLVVNGETHVVGSRRGDVALALSRYRLDLPVEITEDGRYLSIHIDGDASQPEAVVWLVSFRSLAEVEIERGENRGRSLTYTHIVTGRQPLGMWEPASGASLRLPLADIMHDGADGVAVLVQLENGGRPGPVLGAAALTL